MRLRKFDVYDEDNRAVQDAYALLMANVYFRSEKENIKTIAINSWAPKVGKTTVAINLAISLARSGWNTLLIDADLRKPSNFKRLNDDSILGLSDIIEGDIYLLDGISDTNIENLTYLSCGSSHNPIEMFCSHKFADLLVEVREQYEFVVFDTPALSSVIDGAIIAANADGCILVAQMGSTKTTDIDRSREQFEKANVTVLGVALNKVKKRDYRRYLENYDYFFNTKKFKNKMNSEDNNA